MYAPLVVPHGRAVRERGTPPGAVGDTCRDADAHARRAARAVEGGVAVMGCEHTRYGYRLASII